MSANLIALDSTGKLDSLYEESSRRPVVVFKHSSSCGISSHMLSQFDDIHGEINVLVIQENRALSDAVAKRTGHRHHSPQAFVLLDGKPVYHATHYGINPEKIAELLQPPATQR